MAATRKTTAARSAAVPTETVPLEEVAVLDQPTAAQVAALLRGGRFKTWDSGTDGFTVRGKVANQHGHLYQVNIDLYRVGSKTRPAV